MFVGLFFQACARISVETEFDSGHDFSQYKTYAWDGQFSSAQRKQALAEGLRGKVQKAIDREMIRRGYSLVVEEGADLVLVRSGRLRNRGVTATEPREAATLGGGTSWGDPDFDKAAIHESSEQYREGKIALQVSDPRIDQVVWRGSARGVIDDYKSTNSEISEFVKKLMDDFPAHSAES